MVKILVLLLIGVFSWSISTGTVNAEENEDVVYDSEEGGRQTFVVGEGEDKEMIIVEENPVHYLTNDIGINNTGDGSFTISRNVPLQWSPSYRIDVRDRRIVAAYNATHSTVVGSITNVSLNHTNTTSSYNFTYTLVNSTNINLQARIEGTEIVIN